MCLCLRYFRPLTCLSSWTHKSHSLSTLPLTLCGSAEEVSNGLFSVILVWLYNDSCGVNSHPLSLDLIPRSMGLNCTAQLSVVKTRRRELNFNNNQERYSQAYRSNPVLWLRLVVLCCLKSGTANLAACDS